MAPKKKKKESWGNSKGKRLLLGDIRAGRIPDDMHWKTAFESRPEFNVCPSPKKNPEELFSARLRGARDYIKGKNERSSRELALFQQDRVTHPPAAFNHRGEPRWPNSPAEMLLKQDVANNLHLQLTRTQFYLSRPEYQLYPKRVISGHVDQEVRLIKFLKQYVNRRGGF